MMEQSKLINKYDQASPEEKIIIIHDLMKRLACTTDMLERNRIAFFFADHQVTEAVPIVMNIIKNPKCYNQIGSLINALRCYPTMPADYLVDFIPVIANGTFEAAHESYLLILEQMEKSGKTELMKICALLMKMCDQGCANNDLVCDLLDELNNIRL